MIHDKDHFTEWRGKQNKAANLCAGKLIYMLKYGGNYIFVMNLNASNSPLEKWVSNLKIYYHFVLLYISSHILLFEWNFLWSGTDWVKSTRYWFTQLSLILWHFKREIHVRRPSMSTACHLPIASKIKAEGTNSFFFKSSSKIHHRNAILKL